MENKPIYNRIFDVIIGPITEEIKSFEKIFLYQLQSDSLLLYPYRISQSVEENGRLVCPYLFFLSQGLIHRPNPESGQLAALLELLNWAILIHNKVIDMSSRTDKDRHRGVIVDNQKLVLIGDYLLTKVLKLGIEAPWSGTLEIISQVVMAMAKAKLKHELQRREHGLCAKDHQNVSRDEKAVLFGASCELGGLVVNANCVEKDQLRTFGETYGMIRQIRDDILDYWNPEEGSVESVGEDSYEGNVTLPLLLALGEVSNYEKGALFRKLQTNSGDKRRWILDFIDRKNALKKAQHKLDQFKKNALVILGTFSPSIYRDSLERIVQIA